MHILREWIGRVWGTVRGDSDLEQELRMHLELAAEDERRRGQPPQDARRAAGMSQAMNAFRDQRGLPWLDARAASICTSWPARTTPCGQAGSR
jgi:hypothetical protein